MTTITEEQEILFKPDLNVVNAWTEEMSKQQKGRSRLETWNHNGFQYAKLTITWKWPVSLDSM